jgi:FAD/FMN-containing dehydrogenase
MGKYGLTIDNLLSVEIVTADGQVRTANENEHGDLLWRARRLRGDRALRDARRICEHSE